MAPGVTLFECAVNADRAWAPVANGVASAAVAAGQRRGPPAGASRKHPPARDGCAPDAVVSEKCVDGSLLWIANGEN